MLSVEQIERADWLKFCSLFRPNAQLGEPFAHPKAVEIFRAIRKHAPYIELASITNGSLLRKRVVDLIAGNFSLLYISVNATSAETYEKTMPPLKWDRFIANLWALKEAKDKLGTLLPRLDAGYVLYKGNLADLPALPEFLHRFGFNSVNVKPMMPPPRCSTSANLLTPDDSIFTIPEEANLIFRETEAGCKKYNIELVRTLPSLEVLEMADGRPEFVKVDGMPV